MILSQVIWSGNISMIFWQLQQSIITLTRDFTHPSLTQAVFRNSRFATGFVFR